MNAWPVNDVLSKLVEAAEILLHQCDYDGHGYEEIAEAVQRAKQLAVSENFGAEDVRRLQDWLGVTGSIMTDESWDKLDDATRRLYVSEVVKVASECDDTSSREGMTNVNKMQRLQQVTTPNQRHL